MTLHTSHDAADKKNGMTLGELYAFCQEALHTANADPHTLVRVTTGFRSQVQSIRTYGEQDARNDAFMDLFTPKEDQ